MSDAEPPDDGSKPVKRTKAKRWYALYRVVKRSPPTSPAGKSSSDDEAYCASLSVLASNLPGADEISLRIFMGKKIEKGSLSTGDASFVSSMTLKDADVKEVKYSVHSTLLKPEQSGDEASPTDSIPRGFLVCYGSSVPNELESFRLELDAHGKTLHGLLDDKLSGLATTVTACLEEWHEKSIRYVSRAVDALKQNLALVLFASLKNSELDFDGFDQNLENDVRMFANACGIQWVDEPKPPTRTISLKLDQNGNISVGGIESSVPFFCHHWAGAAHSASESSGDDAAVAIKSVIEEYKLKVIQDVNNMRRLIQKANADFYALYKALTFLKHTGNAVVILDLLRDDTICSDGEFSSKSANSVIDILEEFLQT